MQHTITNTHLNMCWKPWQLALLANPTVWRVPATRRTSHIPTETQYKLISHFWPTTNVWCYKINGFQTHLATVQKEILIFSGRWKMMKMKDIIKGVQSGMFFNCCFVFLSLECQAKFCPGIRCSTSINPIFIEKQKDISVWCCLTILAKSHNKKTIIWKKKSH